MDAKEAHNQVGSQMNPAPPAQKHQADIIHRWLRPSQPQTKRIEQGESH